MIIALLFSVLGMAGDGFNGVDCLRQYAEYIHQDIAFPNSQLQDLTNAVKNKFEDSGSKSSDLSAIRWLVAGIPFGVAVLDNIGLVVDAYQVLRAGFGYIRREVRRHRFGETFELLTSLHKLSEEAGYTDAKQDVSYLDQKKLSTLGSYKALIDLEEFKEIVEHGSLPEEQYDDLARELVKQFLEGDLFCGATDFFQPIRIEEVVQYQFLETAEAIKVSTDS